MNSNIGILTKCCYYSVPSPLGISSPTNPDEFPRYFHSLTSSLKYLKDPISIWNEWKTNITKTYNDAAKASGDVAKASDDAIKASGDVAKSSNDAAKASNDAINFKDIPANWPLNYTDEGDFYHWTQTIMHKRPGLFYWFPLIRCGLWFSTSVIDNIPLYTVFGNISGNGVISMKYFGTDQSHITGVNIADIDPRTGNVIIEGILNQGIFRKVIRTGSVPILHSKDLKAYGVVKSLSNHAYGIIDLYKSINQKYNEYLQGYLGDDMFHDIISEYRIDSGDYFGYRVCFSSGLEIPEKLTYSLVRMMFKHGKVSESTKDKDSTRSITLPRKCVVMSDHGHVYVRNGDMVNIGFYELYSCGNVNVLIVKEGNCLEEYHCLIWMERWEKRPGVSDSLLDDMELDSGINVNGLRGRNVLGRCICVTVNKKFNYIRYEEKIRYGEWKDNVSWRNKAKLYERYDKLFREIGGWILKDWFEEVLILVFGE